MYFQYYTNEVSKSFEIKEEFDPSGNVHGAYGLVDSNGDLVYTQYRKDPHGQV